MCKGTFWNYRVMKFTHNSTFHPEDIEEVFQIVEVYYDENDMPKFYCDTAKLVWEEGEDPRGIFDRMQLAFDKPVLTPEDFPDAKDEE